MFEPLLSLSGTTEWKQYSLGGSMQYDIYTGRDRPSTFRVKLNADVF